MLGTCWLLRGDPAAAVEPLQRSLHLHESAPAHAALAQAQAGLQHWEAAAQSAKRATEMEPSAFDYWLLYGQVLAGGGRLAEATSTLTEAADRFPSDPRPHYLLGRVSELLGDRRQAARHYHDALMRDRSFHDARQALTDLISQ